MPTEKQQPQQQHHEDALLLRHAAREQSLSLLKRRAEEFVRFYSTRETAIRGTDRAEILEAEQVLDRSRQELIAAISAELQRVARVNGLHPPQAEEAQTEPPPEEAEPLTAAERQRRYRERKRSRA